MLEVPHHPFRSLQKAILLSSSHLQWSSLLPSISPIATKNNLSLCVTAPLQIREDHCPLRNIPPASDQGATSLWNCCVPDGAWHPAQLHRPKGGEGSLNTYCKEQLSIHTHMKTGFFFFFHNSMRLLSSVWFEIRHNPHNPPLDPFLQMCSLAGFLPSACVCPVGYCKSTSHMYTFSCHSCSLCKSFWVLVLPRMCPQTLHSLLSSTKVMNEYHNCVALKSLLTQTLQYTESNKKHRK